MKILKLKDLVGLGWTLNEIKEIEFHISKSEPFVGSSFIDLQTNIKKKNAIVNVRNNDQKCFMWAILSALHTNVQYPNHMSSYSAYENELNFTGINFPVDVKSIKKFEFLNPTISINVYGIEPNNEIVPLRLCKNIKPPNHFHLLLLHEVENEYVDENSVKQVKIKSHYCWIKDLSKLIRSQLTAHKAKIYFCDRCLHYFTTNDKLQKHIEDCITLNECKITLPREDESIITYENIKKQLEAPYVIYADIESILEQVDDDSSLATSIYQKHKPFSIGYYLKCGYDDSQSYYKYDRGSDCIKWFVQELYSIAESKGKISYEIVLSTFTNENTFLYFLTVKILDDSKPMKFTKEDQLDFNKTNKCHICEKLFYQYEVKVRDHCHLTGKYRGAAHRDCNLAYQVSQTIPVIFHNLI